MKKFENIVIASDLDGTFFGPKATLVERNLRAVKYFTENGGHFAVASGRFFGNILSSFPNAAEYVNMPCVTCNGAVIYDFQKEKLKIVENIPYETVKELVEFIAENTQDAALRMTSEQIGFVYSPRDAQSERVAGEIERVSAEGTKMLIAPTEQWKDLTFYQAVLRADRDEVELIKPMLRERFDGRLYVTQSGRALLDIQSWGVNKGITLRRVVKDTLGDNVTLYTCGDYINDIELHSAADVSVCPANAHDEIKAMCDMCLCSNEEGVVADLIEYLDKTVKN
jgi:Cof subfamily protein (haloacid dehalogenase superfamily)